MRKERLEARRISINNGESEFLWNCGAHGFTPYDTKMGVCKLCWAADDRTPVNIKAKLLGAVLYETFCVDHGLVYHYAKNGKCSGCYDQNGVVKSGGRPGRQLTQEPRAVARREGLPAYEAQCATHGLTWHSVVHGKCLTCFTTAGIARKFAPRVPLPPV